MSDRVTRLAPSPTGALHLGNARTFLINWAIARQSGWKIVARLEDLDSPRVKPDTVAETWDILAWLGLDWDSPILTQSASLAPYRSAIKALGTSGKVFRCHLSRREVRLAASAPQDGAQPTPYPARLRPPPGDMAAWTFDEASANYRLVSQVEPVIVVDELTGPHSISVEQEIGDAVIWTKRGLPGYQLAVVVDDARQGVTDVIRGDDLLPSAAVQQMLGHALGLPIPRWWHVGLVVGPEGRRLAKRHGDTRITGYREAGVGPERIIGLIAYWSGISPIREPMSAEEFRLSFSRARLPNGPITLTEEDHRWLLSSTPPSSLPSSG